MDKMMEEHDLEQGQINLNRIQPLIHPPTRSCIFYRSINQLIEIKISSLAVKKYFDNLRKISAEFVNLPLIVFAPTKIQPLVLF